MNRGGYNTVTSVSPAMGKATPAGHQASPVPAMKADPLAALPPEVRAIVAAAIAAQQAQEPPTPSDPPTDDDLVEA